MKAEELRRLLEEQRLLVEAVARGEYCCLRGGAPYLTPGLLAAQSLCDGLALAYLSSEPRAAGAARLARLLLDARRLVPDELPLVFVLDAPLAGIVQGVPVVGRPAALVFVEGRLRAVVAARVGARLGLRGSDRVRLYAYGALVEAAGLPAAGAALVLAAAESGEALGLALEELRAVLAREGRARPLAGPGYRVHVLAHEPGIEEAALAPLLAFWRGERGEERRRGPWCRGCPARSGCPLLLGAEDG